MTELHFKCGEERQILSTPKIDSDPESRSAVDVVIPVYNERPAVLDETIAACLRQTYPPATIWVVDDGSAKPVSRPSWTTSTSSLSICLLRFEQNQGISAARNAAIARSNTTFVACINAEVLPEPDWLATCKRYLACHTDVGACYTRTIPKDPDRILSRWRMRFQEGNFGEESGPSPFAPGHAVLFRREALDSVGGYNVRLRRIMEDSDVCERMRQAGWATHYIAASRCISIQRDSLAELCNKQLIRSGWTSPRDYSLGALLRGQCKWLLMRVGRNLIKGRLVFIPIDCAVWIGSLLIAVRRYFRL